MLVLLPYVNMEGHDHDRLVDFDAQGRYVISINFAKRIKIVTPLVITYTVVQHLIYRDFSL